MADVGNKTQINGSTYVLCIGCRQGLARAMHKMGISYSVLTDKKLKYKPKGVDQLFTESYQKILENIDSFKKQLPKVPTHIIAVNESGVYPATLLRSYFNARLSEHAMIRRCTDKAEMKTYLRDRLVPMTRFIVDEGLRTDEEIVDQLGLPIVVKEAQNSGGRGIVICKSSEEFKKQRQKNKIYESYIQAPEASVESFIQNFEVKFANVTEYHKKTVANLLPAHFSQPELEEILELNEEVISKMNIKWGMTHLEVYRHTDGLLFGEIALRPPGGYIMNLIKMAYGFNAWEAFVAMELGLDFEFNQSANKYAASLIHHPGKGTIKSVRDISPAEVPSLKKHKVSVKAGDKVSERKGVGMQIGYSLLANKNLEELKWDLDEIISNPIAQIK